jgi:putative SOS response-associated peptidase YedK
MCTRYTSPDQATIERAWHIGRHNQHRWIRDLFPRAQGPFLRMGEGPGLDLIIGTWGLIPSWSKTPVLKYATVNCRSEEASEKPTFRDAWRRSQRCIIPAQSFDEPCWETGKNVWWRFKRVDGQLWGLAGLWNTWVDQQTGKVIESYTMLTVNADSHAVMNRMHKPDPKLPPEQQDKRSVVAIDAKDVERWLHGDTAEVRELLTPPDPALIDAGLA